MSANPTKRAWKLQEFVAHGASVNCLALGHKSGRVLVTGGDDKKVNLWAVGKPNCIMSLSGHTTPIECVRFGHTEELVCAGSASGALKIWDLEAARLVRTLTGHKAGIRCIDFHPYGDFLSSGSGDTNLKLWDIRRKGCIFTYKGHSETVNCLKFSPDGQWVASGGTEGAVKIWDLRAGKMMCEFNDHGGPVYDVEFHPHEFLLASASADRTVNFWDLENFNLVSKSEKDSGPIRTIRFGIEGHCIFSGSHESLKVHTWEPPQIRDTLMMGWGKIKDISIASTQLIGAAYQMSNVSLYVVDLKRVQPFGMTTPRVTTVVNTGVNDLPKNNTSDEFVKPVAPGQVMRRSFVKGQNGARSSPDVKVSEEQSDKSGTDPEDTDENHSQADITDYRHYEEIFRPRQRDLNRTPTMDDEEIFQAPEETPEPVTVIQRPAHLKVRKSSKKPSPSPTRRSSQPPTSAPNQSSPVRMRKGSNPPTPTTAGGARPPQFDGPPSPTRLPESVVRPPKMEYTSLTPVSKIQINQPSERPLDRPTLVRPQRTSTVLINEGGGGGNNCAGNSNSAPVQVVDPFLMMQRQMSTPTMMDPNMMLQLQQQQLLQQQQQSQQQHPQGPQSYLSMMPASRGSEPNLNQKSANPNNSSNSKKGSVMQQQHVVDTAPPEKEKIEVIPLNLEKPTGLEMGDFLPMKFQMMGLGGNTLGGCDTSKFSAFKSYGPPNDLSETEVTSSILKGHESMMAALTNRGRQVEILQKMWQNKDAKTAVEQAGLANDQSVLVDLLSVITLRPSIWNLDLCTALLPSLEKLLQSKYEMYITQGCDAMKLILKNFGSVIKSNIDSPIQTVGVDISREERHNKCMECYKDLVKIRSLILKRQAMQGKLGHTFRELSILMQYLD